MATFKKITFSILLFSFLIVNLGCKRTQSIIKTTSVMPAFTWDNASIYFLLTDRFYNADKSNDYVHPVAPAAYRGFMGGDIKGITQKIKEGYFDSLGVHALWMTPLVENVTEGVDEGTGHSYGFHGYWTRDWTAIDSRIGNKKDIREMVKEAHQRGIRILLDVVINHTGPVTPTDTKWPDDWVRTSPQCTYKGYSTTIECTLVKNLPDIKTESTQEVGLPDFLIEKWKKEGRYEKEIAGLDNFFKRTNYPRRPYYYIVKWLTDYIREFGIDGFRVDTVKHTEEEVWTTLWNEAQIAYADWKKNHPAEVLDDQEFYMVGEVYNYNANNGRDYDFGDKKVDYFNHGFKSLINFGFKYDAEKDARSLFEQYDRILSGPLNGKSIVHYISSHDDGSPFDKNRTKVYDSATKLLLSPGAIQLYYGDESARNLDVQANGDAKLRSFMNWEQLNHPDTTAILKHWQKLGQFRKRHNAVGAGRHKTLQVSPFIFSRSLEGDKVVCGIDLPIGTKVIPVGEVFSNGTKLRDAYSGKIFKVSANTVKVDSPFKIVLLENIN
ncbi:MAG: alpha-amylase [Saprospiraceae bacterium]|nr:alpha-amylase [Saprospiraceae bacterium]